MHDPDTPTVALFSEHLLLGEALRSLLEAVGHFAVTGVETTPTDFLTRVGREPPDLVVLHAGNGISPELVALMEQVSAYPTVAVVDSVDGRSAERCLAAGARGVLETTTDPVTILAALRQVLNGHAVVPARTREPLVRANRSAALAGLSDRQRAVLKLLVAGCSNTEIASELCISKNTVKFHIRTIFRELGLHSRVEAARRYPLLAAEAG
jgi:DNA-binding NarL/FixJ family response regulator